MNGDLLLEYEENNYDALVEKFTQKHIDLWQTFVYNEYIENQGYLADLAYDNWKERK